MKTITSQTHGAIIADARMVYENAAEDEAVAGFKRRIPAHVLAELLSSILALEKWDGASDARRHDQGVAQQTATAARAALAKVLAGIRDDALLELGKGHPLTKGFGRGSELGSKSAGKLKHVAELVLATALEHPKEAAKVSLDSAGQKRVKALVASLDEAVRAHATSEANRHDAAMSVAATARAVKLEVSRVRLAARRVFIDDPKRLARYASELRRHAPKPRPKAPVAAPPVAAPPPVVVSPPIVTSQTGPA